MEQLISVRSLFKETDAYAGKQIKVGGWVRNLRASKNFGFINLSDGTFFSQVQVVYGSDVYKRQVVDFAAAVGAFAVLELALGPEAFAGRAVHALIRTLVDIALVVHLLEDALDGDVYKRQSK